MGYQRQHLARERPATSEILGLVQVGESLDFPLKKLAEPITTRFPPVSVRIMGSLSEPTEAYDSRRRQFHSTRILVLLEQKLRDFLVDKLLGVTRFDLFVPGLNFVFGEARLPGRVGVISTHRLKTTSREQTDLFEKRVAKEAIHEVGHMSGMEHCSDTSCVMYFSNTLADTDHKGTDFCTKCQPQLRMRFE